MKELIDQEADQAYPNQSVYILLNEDDDENELLRAAMKRDAIKMFLIDNKAKASQIPWALVTRKLL